MPAESVAFTYDGADTVTATISGAANGTSYELDASGGFDIQVAAGGMAVLTADVSGFGLSAGDVFTGTVFVLPMVTQDEIGFTLFTYGTPGELSVDASWSYAAATKTISVTFPTVNGHTYTLYSNDNTNGFVVGGTNAGTGVPLVLTSVLGATPDGDYWQSFVFDNTTSMDVTVRLFSGAGDSEGFPGNPLVSPYVPVPPPEVAYSRVYGIQIALSDDGVEQVTKLVTSLDGFA